MSFEAYLDKQKVFSIGLVLVAALFVALSAVPGHAHAAAVTLVTATTTSNNASTTLAKVGDTITFGLTLSATPSATSTPTINLLNMGTTSFTGSGTFWQYSTTSVSAWSNGTLTFYEAWGGTLGESTTTISQTSLTGANIRFDKTVPTISSITSSASCTGTNGTCKAGDTITFTLTPGATEYAATIVGSYNSHALAWSTANSGVTFTATYTVAKGDSGSSSPVQISGVVITDAAGNASSAGAGSDVAVAVNANVHGTPVVITGSSNSSSSSSTTGETTSTNTSTGTSAPAPSNTANDTGTPASTPSASFTRSLQAGSKGDDVKWLQVFLNTHGFKVAISGPGANGLETSLFGKLTKAALAKFQAANGIRPAVGYFGPITRAFIAGMK